MPETSLKCRNPRAQKGSAEHVRPELCYEEAGTTPGRWLLPSGPPTRCPVEELSGGGAAEDVRHQRGIAHGPGAEIVISMPRLASRLACQHGTNQGAWPVGRIRAAPRARKRIQERPPGPPGCGPAALMWRVETPMGIWLRASKQPIPVSLSMVSHVYRCPVWRVRSVPRWPSCRCRREDGRRRRPPAGPALRM